MIESHNEFAHVNIVMAKVKALFGGFFRTQLLRYFKKSSELMFKILIYYYTSEFYCFKIIKTYTNGMVDVLVFQTVDDLKFVN